MNYLIVQKSDEKKVSRDTEKMHRQVDARGTKGDVIAERYERELNGGATAKECIVAGCVIYYTVYYEPASQSRAWTSYERWMDNPVYP